MLVAKLTDSWFDAEFVGEAGETGGYRHQGGQFHGAQGLFLWCPCGWANPRYREVNGGRPNGVLIGFRNPVGAPPPPPKWGPYSKTDRLVHPRWEIVCGTGLADLSLSPSIDVDCWHGYVTNGEVSEIPPAPPA